MADYVTLLGAEEVSRAANQIRVAADTMGAAINNLSDVLDRHQRFMDDWLTRLDGTLQDRTHDLGVTLGPLG